MKFTRYVALFALILGLVSILFKADSNVMAQSAQAGRAVIFVSQSEDETPTPEPSQLQQDLSPVVEQYKAELMVMIPNSLLEYLKWFAGFMLAIVLAVVFMLFRSAPAWVKDIMIQVLGETKKGSLSLKESLKTPTLNGQEIDNVVLSVFEQNLDLFIEKLKEERDKEDSPLSE